MFFYNEFCHQFTVGSPPSPTMPDSPVLGSPNGGGEQDNPPIGEANDDEATHGGTDVNEAGLGTNADTKDADLVGQDGISDGKTKKDDGDGGPKSGKLGGPRPIGYHS